MKRSCFATTMRILPALCLLFTGRQLHAAELFKVIQSGFESDVVIDGNTFAGMDNSVPVPNNWSSFPGDFSFRFFEQGEAEISIADNPSAPGERVSVFEIFDDNGDKGRAQGTFMMEGPAVYNTMLCRIRIFIPEDWKALVGMLPERDWKGFFEMWTHLIPEDQCDRFDGSGSFRLGFTFEIPEGMDKFAWKIKGENRSYYSSEGAQNWYYLNDEIDIPFGRWATYEYYVVKGPDPKTNPDSPARFRVRIMEDGKSWQTVFDITNERTEHSHRPQDGYLKFQPFKNYCGRKNIDYLTGIGKRVYYLFDDMQFWASTGVASPGMPPAP